MKSSRLIKNATTPPQQSAEGVKPSARKRPVPQDGIASTSPRRRTSSKDGVNLKQRAPAEGQHLLEVQNDSLSAGKKDKEEEDTLRRYASLHADLIRVQAELAEVNERLEQRVIERTANLTSANRELHHEFKERQRLEHELSERERSNLSQALHDGVCQHLAGVVMIATTLSDIFGQKSDPEMAGKLKEIASLIRTANNDVRDVARALHPADVDANGLVPALRNLVGCYAVPGRTRCVLYCHEAIPVHDNDVAMHLYRIVLEAVLNASRHAHASHISVHLGVRQKDIMLSITDDGVGLPSDYEKSAGLGLKLMRHRASSIGATLSIASRPSGGTVVRCCLPPPA